MYKIFRSAVLLAFGIIISQVSGLGQSAGSLSLNGSWKLSWNEGGHGPQSIAAFIRSKPANDPARYLDVPVPMEIHLALQQQGLCEDLNYGMNTLRARWIAEKYWQYVKVFSAPEDALKQHCWLVFEQLDLNATILLNGEIIGTHNSVFVPCRIDVTDKLKKGENLLQIGLESGLYGVADKDGASYLQNMGALLNKRHWLRKPQYQFLWDWNPQLINVGITGPVRLDWSENLRLDQVSVYSRLNEELTIADITLRSQLECMNSGETVSLHACVLETGDSIQQEFVLKPGMNTCESHLRLGNPKLWWPAGQGRQNLYQLQLELRQNGKVIASANRRTGIRKVEIDQSAHPVRGNYFTILVNNRRVFMKGGNWVPPDMIYSAVSKARLDTLTDLAVRANFNMLRIWGGAIWAGHDLLDLCDEKGLLVWHDLLFACSKYPGDDKDFNAQVQQEVLWGVREFSPHPSLAIWCGNNENEVGTWNWGWDKFGKQMPDYGLYHLSFPQIIKAEDPSRPYWPSSPYSKGIEDPNSPYTGDQHPWNVMLGSAGPDFWEYRSYVDRFPNEGGVLGASSPATLRQFLPPAEQKLRSFSWDHHDNEVNFWTDNPGINYQMTEFWLGKKASDIAMQDYALASALLQAEGLTEYITNYRRRMFSSSSAIFWMFNDSWPVTHGWTIVDYYLRKKLAFHPVRRAYEPVSCVLAVENDSLKVFGVNDSPSPWRGSLHFGICRLAGGIPLENTMDVQLPTNASILLKAIPLSQWKQFDTRKTAAFSLLIRENKLVASHRLFMERFKELEFAQPKIILKKTAGGVSFTSPVFVWGACIDTDGEKDVPDNCFDLLPGIPYVIPWNSKELPKVLFSGNQLF